jgi:biotin carboxyl carrier protein
MPHASPRLAPELVSEPPALFAVVGGKASQPVLAERVLEFQAKVLSHETFDEAATTFATELAAILQFDRAAIGFCRSGRTHVVATSNSADFEPAADLFSAFSAAMDEALDQNSTVACPSMAGSRPLVTLAHAELGKRYGGTVLSVPLVARGRAFGALTLARASGGAPGKEEIALCEHLACIVGPILELKKTSERAWHARLFDALRAAADRIGEPGNTAAKAGVVAAVAALVALLLIPVQYRVGAHARIEGSVQRALVAPADGFLRQVHVRPGDRVKTGQVLAELAEEDLKLEQRKWQSELTQHENAASASLARSERSQYVINQSKADEARAQLDLTERQLARSRVLAPFDGVVIKGDLSQSLGAPLRRGDVLLTIAPAGEFRLLVEVDERDIPAVRAGERGSVALGALDRALPFRVARVTPVATTRDGRNFFEVEGELDESPTMLRPGLQGVAKIDAGSHSLAWIGSHRLLEWARLGLWSWGL